MDVRVKGTNYVISPEVERYLDERLNALTKLLGEHANVARCEVELARDAGRPRHGANVWVAEIHLVYPGGSVYARNNSESINGAIDDVKDEVERQLHREKKLHIRILRKGGAMLKRLIRSGEE
jgi:ribosomal subunit interface protein